MDPSDFLITVRVEFWQANGYRYATITTGNLHRNLIP
jgi:hypothetical protein